MASKNRGVVLRSRRTLTASKLGDIGSVAVESTYSEVFIERLIWGLAGMRQEAGKFFTNPLRMDKRLELLADLGKQQLSSAHQKASFTRIISRLKEANNKRNLIVHGVWRHGLTMFELLSTPNPPKNVPAKTVKKRLRDKQHDELPATKVRATAREIALWTRKLNAFAQKHWPQLPMWTRWTLP